MKVSYKGLNSFFEKKLPPPSDVAKALTFHAWEIEEVLEQGGDTILDVKVLPDKTPWALSHRGIAKDLSVILGMPLSRDPLKENVALEPKIDSVHISLETEGCSRYIAAQIRGIRVGPSPAWLVEYLASLGQRSINNVVDATNYVMYELGQPLHAFDAGKLAANSIRVRAARTGEEITVLTGETFSLTGEDMLIADGKSDMPIGIAGIKGGRSAEIDEMTTDIILESANFDHVMVRKTSQRLRLRTDASIRFENGIVPRMSAYGAMEAVRVILEVAGGECVGYAEAGTEVRKETLVTVTLEKMNSVLGLDLSKDAVESIITRFGYEHSWEATTLSIVSPFERTDLALAEDLIEEVGRMHGYEHVASVTPKPAVLLEVNSTFYYTDKVRSALVAQGFSEVFTSSFRSKDQVKLKNALASDKAYVRSALTENMKEVLIKNAPNIDMLGMRDIRVFELGTVFAPEKEMLSIALGVSGPSGFREKQHGPILDAGKATVASVFGALVWKEEGGVAEAVFTDALASLPQPTAYEPVTKGSEVVYKPHSPYPFIARDVALWVPEGTTSEHVEHIIRKLSGPLLLRASLFDEFKKDGKISYAFRLVFQSFERTLTDDEINEIMHDIAASLEAQNYTVR